MMEELEKVIVPIFLRNIIGEQKKFEEVVYKVKKGFTENNGS